MLDVSCALLLNLPIISFRYGMLVESIRVTLLQHATGVCRYYGQEFGQRLLLKSKWHEEATCNLSFENGTLRRLVTHTFDGVESFYRGCWLKLGSRRNYISVAAFIVYCLLDLFVFSSSNARKFTKVFVIGVQCTKKRGCYKMNIFRRLCTSLPSYRPEKCGKVQVFRGLCYACNWKICCQLHSLCRVCASVNLCCHGRTKEYVDAAVCLGKYFCCGRNEKIVCYIDGNEHRVRKEQSF